MRPQRTCTEDGCTRPHLARGLCKRHYERWQRTRPEYRAKAQASDRKRRQTDEHRARDRERLRKRRIKRGIKPRPTPEEMERRRAEQRKRARHEKAQRKLDRAALGASRPRTWTAGPCPGLW